MGNMKKRRWIGSLLLTVLACVSELRGQDAEWQAVSDAPRTQAASATLTAPALLPSSVSHSEEQSPIAETPVSSGTPAGLPVRYEPSTPKAAKSSNSPPGEIIAVSVPVTAPATLPFEGQDEVIDTPFAVDRPIPFSTLPPFAPRKEGEGGGGGIVQTSASVVVPAVDTGAEAPLIAGRGAPADEMWGRGMPTGPLPPDPDAPAFSPFNYNPMGPRTYASAEYLLWWIQGQSAPVLATTSAPSDFGVIGAPTTQSLFGGNRINGSSPFSGGRFTLGYWLGCDQSKALEITGFFLGTRSAGFSTNSSLSPVIGRPFVEANNGTETALLTSLPGVATGSLTVNAPTLLWGLAGNLRFLLCSGCNYRITALAGFSNLNLDESLTITENTAALPASSAPLANPSLTVTDDFATQNHFYGGNLGADARWYWGRLSVDVRGQVALGDTVQYLNISGNRQLVLGAPAAGGLMQTFNGGLLALPSNIGHFSHNAFSVVPQVGVNIGYQFLPKLRGFVGYNFLYWSNVIRPGTSIDRALDVTQIPNFPVHPAPPPAPGHPAPSFHEVGLWAQGLTFGFEFVY